MPFQIGMWKSCILENGLPLWQLNQVKKIDRKYSTVNIFWVMMSFRRSGRPKIRMILPDLIFFIGRNNGLKKWHQQFIDFDLIHLHNFSVYTFVSRIFKYRQEKIQRVAVF